MKASEGPSRFWIVWILFGLLLPLFAVFLRMRHPAPPPDVAPSSENVVVERSQNGKVAIAKDEGETTDLAVEEVFEEALSFDENGIESFLRTDYEPLSKWLDERFEVDLTAMTPSYIFEVVPLNDIYYELKIDPSRETKASFQASNISRRELLKRISDHWNLHFEIKYGNGGEPTAVQITSR